MAIRPLIFAAAVTAFVFAGCGSPKKDLASDPNSNVNVSQQKPVIGGPGGDEGTGSK